MTTSPVRSFRQTKEPCKYSEPKNSKYAKLCFGLAFSKDLNAIFHLAGPLFWCLVLDCGLCYGRGDTYHACRLRCLPLISIAERCDFVVINSRWYRICWKCYGGLVESL
jgi:hypothetical protein